MPGRDPLPKPTKALFIPSPFEPKIGIPLVFVMVLFVELIAVSWTHQISDVERQQLSEAAAIEPW